MLTFSLSLVVPYTDFVVGSEDYVTALTALFIQ